jgi:hypothetical protein
LIRRALDNMKEPSRFFNNLLRDTTSSSRDHALVRPARASVSDGNRPAEPAGAPPALRVARELWQG